ncbi:hypothetical protein ACL6C3_30840 [Capilliphycus salinus ALCB114379]|uniref:hypothetical protein n=1 Tax=Capilliphycus salinus TaxID=2768948 RepID=UPI0039A5DC02
MGRKKSEVRSQKSEVQELGVTDKLFTVNCYHSMHELRSLANFALDGSRQVARNALSTEAAKSRVRAGNE